MSYSNRSYFKQLFTKNTFYHIDMNLLRIHHSLNFIIVVVANVTQSIAGSNANTEQFVRSRISFSNEASPPTPKEYTLH